MFLLLLVLTMKLRLFSVAVSLYIVFYSYLLSVMVIFAVCNNVAFYILLVILFRFFFGVLGFRVSSSVGRNSTFTRSNHFFNASGTPLNFKLPRVTVAPSGKYPTLSSAGTPLGCKLLSLSVCSVPCLLVTKKKAKKRDIRHSLTCNR